MDIIVLYKFINVRKINERERKERKVGREINYENVWRIMWGFKGGGCDCMSVEEWIIFLGFRVNIKIFYLIINLKSWEDGLVV